MLCKEVLRSLSPPGSNEVLIKVRKRAEKSDDGQVRFVGDGNNTIGREEIEKLFRQLGIDADLSGLKRLADIRNDIEHMFPSGTASIREAIADALPIIRSLIVNVLNHEPAGLLGEATWGSMLEQEAVYRAEAADCRKSFGSVCWSSAALEAAFLEIVCNNCGSRLLRNDNYGATAPLEISLVCSHCWSDNDLEDVLESALQEALHFEDYVAVKDGGEPPLDECTDCGRRTFICSEGTCVLCGYTLEGAECAVCFTPLSLDDFRYSDGGLCSYHQSRVGKDD